MCVCVYIYTCTYLYVHIYMHIKIYVYMFLYIALCHMYTSDTYTLITYMLLVICVKTFFYQREEK